MKPPFTELVNQLDQHLQAIKQKRAFLPADIIYGHAEILALHNLNKKHAIWYIAKFIESGKKIEVKFECNCGFSKIGKVTKSYLSKLIVNGGSKIICDDCEKAMQDETTKKDIIEKRNLNQQQEIGAEKFIDKYLDPTKVWLNEIKSHDRMMALTNHYRSVFTKREIIASAIQQMMYNDFLKTPYWTAISQEIKRRDQYKCRTCSSQENLNVHHRTYEVHGYEIENQDDLTTLCHDCHLTFHASRRIRP